MPLDLMRSTAQVHKNKGTLNAARFRYCVLSVRMLHNSNESTTFMTP